MPVEGSPSAPVNIGPFGQIVSVAWARSGSPTGVALVTINGPGGAGVAGTILVTSGPVKTGRAVKFDPAPMVAGGVNFQSTSSDFSDLSILFTTESDTGHPELVSDQVLYDNELNRVAALGLGTVTVIEHPAVGRDGLPLGQSVGGPWFKEFDFYVMTRPGFVDLQQSSFVVQLDPTPAHPPPPPTTTWIEFDVGRIQPYTETLTNTVTVVGYRQTAPTMELPNPPAMAFTPQSDGTILVTGGTELWNFTVSQVDSASGSPTTVIDKFDATGPIS